MNTENKVVTFDISWKLIYKVALIAGIILIGSKIASVIVVIFLGIVIASALLPLVKFFNSKKIPTIISVMLTYLLALIAIVAVGFLIINPVKADFKDFSANVPALISKTADMVVTTINKLPFGKVSEDQVMKFLNSSYEKYLTPESIMDSAGKTVSAISYIGGFIGSLAMALVLTTYILLDHDNFVDILILRIIDDKQRALVRELIIEVEQKLGRWFISMLSLMLIIGSMSFILLKIFGMKFSLPLAAIAGLLTVIPSIGPMISVIPAILVALIDKGYGWAAAVGVGYLIIQQIDNAFITPRIMGNLAGTKPVIVFIAVLIGFSLGDILGAFLTVPILALLRIFYDFYIKLKRLKIIGS